MPERNEHSSSDFHKPAQEAATDWGQSLVTGTLQSVVWNIYMRHVLELAPEDFSEDQNQEPQSQTSLPDRDFGTAVSSAPSTSSETAWPHQPYSWDDRLWDMMAVLGGFPSTEQIWAAQARKRERLKNTPPT